MATTKKTSKAKTKTTKTAAAKTASAKTAKTTKTAKVNKPAVKKAPAQKVVAASAKKQTRTKTDRKTILQRLNLLSVAVGVIGAAAAAFLMNQTSYQLFTGMLTTNPLTGALAPAVHAVYDIELRWVVVFILVLSAIVPLLAATRNRRQYQASLDAKVMLWRWVDMAVIGGLIVATIALLSGAQDIMTLVLAGGFIAVTCVLGWMSEKQNSGVARTFRSSYTLSLFTGAMPWLLIAVYALGTPIWGMVHNIWAVYALYATTILCFSGFALTQRNYLDGKLDYEVSEQRYLIYSILAKAAFAALLIIGFAK